MSPATDGFSAIINVFPMCLIFLQRNKRRFTEADRSSLSVGKLAQKAENVNGADKNRIFFPDDFPQMNSSRSLIIPDLGQCRMTLEQYSSRRRAGILHPRHAIC